MPFRQTRFSFVDGEKKTHSLVLVEGTTGQQGAALLDGRWIVLRVLAGEGRADYRCGALDFHLKSDRWGTSWTLRCADREVAGQKVDVLLQEAVLSKIDKGPANELFQGDGTDTILRRHGWKSHEGGEVEPAGPAERTLHESVEGMERRVVVVPVILALNVVVWAVMMGQGAYSEKAGPAAILDWGAEYAPYILQGQAWRFLTAMFLHANLLHLASNMLALWAAGPFVERIVGRTGFGVLYGISGLFGGVLSLYDYKGMPSLGASGAIFGVFGGLVGLMFRYHVYVRRRDVVKYVVLIVLLIIEAGMELSHQRTSIRGGVNVAAHAGGLVSGFVIGLLLSRPVPPARRWRRDAAIAGAGLLLAAGLTWLRPPVVDILKAVEDFAKVGVQLRDRMIGLLSKLNRGGVSYREIADSFDRQVLAYWESESARFEESLRKGPRNFRRIAPSFSDTFRLETQGLALISEAIRKNDSSIVTVAMKRFEAAGARVETLVEELTK